LGPCRHGGAQAEYKHEEALNSNSSVLSKKKKKKRKAEGMAQAEECLSNKCEFKPQYHQRITIILVPIKTISCDF
jgi:hypothetical protein